MPIGRPKRAAPPGFKLVPKRGTRDWKDVAAASAFLHALGLEASDIHNPLELRSPTQIETLLGKRKQDKKTIAPWVISRSSGTTLVALSDTRREVTPSAIRDFQDSSTF